MSKESKAFGKTELIEEVAKSTKLEKTKVKLVIDGTIDAIERTLKKGGKVQLTGFGNFSVALRKKRSGVNPKTGEKIQIAARKVPKFTPGEDLKEMIHPTQK